jgi:hypothetical protein
MALLIGIQAFAGGKNLKPTSYEVYLKRQHVSMNPRTTKQESKNNALEELQSMSSQLDDYARRKEEKNRTPDRRRHLSAADSPS